MQTEQISVLVLLHTDKDMENVVGALRRGGFEPVWREIASAAELKDALTVRNWDFALVDDDGQASDEQTGGDQNSDVKPLDLCPGAVLAAIADARSSTRVITVADGYDIKRVSGLIKSGVVDCVLRSNLDRLPSIVVRERQLIQNVRRNEQYVRAIVDSVEEAVIGFDASGIVESYSASAENIFGYAADDVIGSNIQVLMPEVPDGETSSFSVAVQYALDADNSVRLERDVECRRINGENFSGKISISNISVDGRTGFAVIVRDTTMETQAEAERTRFLDRHGQSQKLEAIGTLAGGIAHDFNNILAAIMGFAHSALLDLDEESDTGRDISSVISSAERGANLTSQILAFSRKDDNNPELVEFPEVVRAGLEMSRAAIASNVVFQSDIETSSAVVVADATQWQQVVLNLCLNSAQAMEENGGTIDVRLRRVDIKKGGGRRDSDFKPGPYYEFSVADDGVGMSKSIRDRVFEPFFTSKGPGKGTGLGMAVVHGIVTSHGGTISISSEPNVGTTVTILIPCAEVEAVATAEVASHGVEPGANGLEHILFVDDEAAICQAMVRPLGRLGYQVSTFTSSREALAAFQASPEKFDLVITDQTMPQLNGSNLAREISTLREDIPIVICSGYHPEMTVESLGISNVREILTKPIAPRRLGELIRELIA